jgi:hypothetical protein
MRGRSGRLQVFSHCGGPFGHGVGLARSPEKASLISFHRGFNRLRNIRKDDFTKLPVAI